MRALAFLLVITVIALFGCVHFFNKEYVLDKKYPLDVQPLRIKFLSDSTGLISQEKGNESQKFGFRYKKHFIVIVSIDDDNLMSLKKGDTIVYHKDKLYVFDKKAKVDLQYEEGLEELLVPICQ